MCSAEQIQIGKSEFGDPPRDLLKKRVECRSECQDGPDMVRIEWQHAEYRRMVSVCSLYTINGGQRSL